MAFDRDAFLRERETLQNLTTKYEKVDLGGAILIDGHHVFLSIIAQISNFRANPVAWLKKQRLANDDPAIDTFTKSSIMNFDAAQIAFLYGSICMRIEGNGHAIVFERLFNDSRSMISPASLGFEISRGISEEQLLAEHPPEEWVVSENRTDRFIFDARLPKKNNVVNSLQRSYDYWLSRNEKNANGILDYLMLAKDGYWAFFENDIRGSIVTPYDLKNNVLEDAERDHAFGNFKTVLRERWINAYSGRVISKEKGVDTNLVIKGCEYANDASCDWIWLVTNDGDHAPLIDHMKSKNKEVFLTSISERPSQNLINSLETNKNFFDPIELLAHNPAEAPFTLTIDYAIGHLLANVALMEALEKRLEDSGISLPSIFE